MRLVYVAIVLVCAAGLAPVHAQLDLRFSYPGFHKFCSGASVIAYPPDPKVCCSAARATLAHARLTRSREFFRRRLQRVIDSKGLLAAVGKLAAQG